MLITGGTGLLGSELASFFSQDYDIYRVGSADFDIRRYDQVKAYFSDAKPDIVLHTAAMVNVDACETERELAMSVNGEGAGNVARACKESGTRMVYYSTDYVFDGSNSRPYVETDATNPVNFYGVSKLEGEKRVETILGDYVILRVAWLYSRSPRSFINKLIESGTRQVREKGGASQPGAIRVVSDQIGTPTAAVDVARQTALVLEKELSGLFHCTAEGETSRYDLAKFIFDNLALDVDLAACPSREFNWRARRPPYSVLENKKLNQMGLNVMRHYRVAVREFLKDVGRRP